MSIVFGTFSAKPCKKIQKYAVLCRKTPDIEQNQLAKFKFAMLNSENFLYCVKIPVAVKVIGFKVAGFGPFVPAVDGDKRSFEVFMAVDICLCHFKAFLYIFGSVADNDIAAV